jgi:hypothetical protein
MRSPPIDGHAKAHETGVGALAGYRRIGPRSLAVVPS